MSSLLIVEDNRLDREIIGRKLDGRFYMQFADGITEADWKFHSQTFDAILLDMVLRDAAFDDALIAIKARAPHSAVVVLSGYTDPELRKRIILGNASSYLIKGVDDHTGEELAVRITQAIQSNRANRIARELYLPKAA